MSREHLPTCQYCGCTPRHIPDLTISADGRCNICDVEWRAIEAQGFQYRAVVLRWNKAANQRRADRKRRMADARQAKAA